MAVMASVLSAERLFALLVNATGMVMLIVYLLLVLAHIAFARRGGTTRLPRLIGPGVVGAMLAIIVSMLATPGLASQAYAGLASTGLLIAIYPLIRRIRQRRTPSTAM